MTTNNTTLFTKYPDTHSAIMEKQSRKNQYPLLSGIIIGIIGGIVGTLIYNLFKNSAVYTKLNSVFDYTLKAINLSYKLPVYAVVILVIIAVTGLLFYNKKAIK